jgi:16S rRNA (guanine527-N7)-methyltransferase
MAGTTPPEEFRRICRRNGLDLSDSQIILLAHFVDGVLEWNSKINLISRRDQENIWFSHVLHSLTPLFYIGFSDGLRVLDLGTGGGFPGIPLAIARPDLEVVLLDSIRKKTLVVQDLVDRLGLTGVSVWTGRAEEAHLDQKAGGTFDLVVTRAVASLRELVHWSRPYLRVSRSAPGETNGGNRVRFVSPGLVALKGGDLEKEIAETKSKESVRSVQIIRMSFEGSIELGLEDKKAVIVSV